MKYKFPPAGTSMDGLGAHTDKPLCVILFADQVSGLEVQTKDGRWLNLTVSPNSFVFMVGDPLMAWSNGRLHAVRTSGDNERYSIGTFLVPVEGTIIKPPKELVDEEHPQILRDFDYHEFINFSNTKEAMAIDSAKQIIAFAAIKWNK
uniref:Fe2OG dioxygenase domain-containing protein n=1 Tax=Kalanchoe fedtschenkoi TaxID=63787 RepID=A0A7N0V363_KALFE